MMSNFIRFAKIKEIFIVICIFQISNAFPISDTGEINNLKQKREVNIIQDKLIHTLHPQPILDTITETEKCCNYQQHLVGKTILTVIEKITGTAANVIQLPQQSVNKVGAGITEYLNQIGAKLVGLQK